MNDFLTDIQIDSFLLDISSSSINIESLNSGSATVLIDEQNDKILILQSSILNTINNIEIERYNDYNLILTNTVYANLPDEIPMSIITGNLHVSRIDGLDDYLTTIPIDGGSP